MDLDLLIKHLFSAKTKNDQRNPALILDVGEKITFKCGQSVITMDKAGNISVNGKVGKVTMDQLLKLFADLVKIN